MPPYRTDGVPPACFLVPKGQGQAPPFARLRSGWTESRLLVSLCQTDEDKSSFCVTSYRTDEVPFVLVPCWADKDLFPLLRLAALTAQLTTVKMSARAGSPNCSADTRHTVYLFSGARSISLAPGIPLSILGASFLAALVSFSFSLAGQ